MTATPLTDRSGIRIVQRLTVDTLLLVGACLIGTLLVVAVGVFFPMNAAVVRWFPAAAESSGEIWSGVAGTAVLMTCALALIVQQRRSLVGWLLLAYVTLDCLEGLADEIGLTGLHVPGSLFAGAAGWAALAEACSARSSASSSCCCWCSRPGGSRRAGGAPSPGRSSRCPFCGSWNVLAKLDLLEDPDEHRRVRATLLYLGRA